jgi:hypothetical protein
MQTRLSHPTPSVLTASLVISTTEAFVAFSDERRTLGPNGEPRISRLLHTRDAGASWRELPWVRSLLSRIRHPGYPTWPPEAVLRMELRNAKLVISHRDEWVPYEPGGESLWESTFDWSEWQAARIRVMDYEGSDAATPPFTRVVPSFPRGFTPPVSR